MIANVNDLIRLADEISLRWVITLCHFLWQGAAIGCIVLIGQRALRRHSSAVRYTFTSAALLCMPACVALTFVLVEVSLSPGPSSMGTAISSPDDLAESPPHDSANSVLLPTQPMAPARHGQTFAVAPVDPQFPSDPSGFQSLESALAQLARPISAIYLMVASLLLLRLAAALWGGHRLRYSVRENSDPALTRIVAQQARQMGLRFVPLVGYCQRVAVPTVLGVVKPMLLFPAVMMGLDANHLAAIVSHELAHIRRYDGVMNLVQRIVESLLFFHPATWYVSRRMCAEREMCCDDLVLATGKERLGYAQALVEMAELCLGARCAGAAELAAAGNSPSELEQRILRLIDASPTNSLRLTRAGFSMLLVCLALMLAAPAVFRATTSAVQGAALTTSEADAIVAQKTEKPADAEPSTRTQGTSSPTKESAKQPATSAVHPVSVLCVDAEGEPVEGAEVYLFQTRGGQYLPFHPLKSDAKGQVQFPQAIFTNSLGNFDRWVYARVPGKLVGVARSARWISQRNIINPEVRVTLVPSRSVEGSATVPEGSDPRIVTVSVRVMHIVTGGGDFDYQSFPRELSFPGLDTSLPARFEAQPDAEGRFRFDDVPVHGRLYLVTTGKGLGEAQWRNDWNRASFDEPLEIKIEKELLLTGRVLSPDGKPVGGVEVSARIASRGAAMYLSTFRAVTNNAGEFQIAGLPAVPFVVYARDPDKRWVFRPLEGVQGSLTTGKGLSLKMETGTEFSGRVVDADGNGVEGAAISALADTSEGSGLDDDVSDRTGRYHLRVPAGAAKLYFNALPDGFKYPEPQIMKRLDIAAGQPAIKDLNFTLERKGSTDPPK